MRRRWCLFKQCLTLCVQSHQVLSSEAWHEGKPGMPHAVSKRTCSTSCDFCCKKLPSFALSTCRHADVRSALGCDE